MNIDISTIEEVYRRMSDEDLASVQGDPEKIGWAIAVMCTAGLALPFYLARRRSARRRTVTTYR